MTWAGSEGALLDWAASARPFRGEVVSGDLHLVAPYAGGVLVAVVDGLGHGPDAEKSARVALDAMGRAPSQPVDALARRCHGALNRLRGAAMSLASFDAAHASVTWLGVGNVEAALLHVDERSGRLTRERLLLWGGIVGQNLPTLRPATLPVAPGDTIVFATDGVRSEFVDEVDLAASVGSIANRILAKHATGSDDALVLVARYRGGTA